jgi:transcriptional regulator with XRE-family HTH domain
MRVDMSEEKDEMIMVNHITLGEKVKLSRVALHLRQVDLASKAGCCMRDISNIEHDRILIVRISTVKKILDVLGIEAEGTAGGDLEQ